MSRKTKMKQSAFFGAIAGLVVFTIFLYFGSSLWSLLFIPFGALMGWATIYAERE
ncbi:MAG TPA: hypothetical protein VJX93_05415 [Candidatus Methanomethylophilaceae archaeon]|nr:hypothetical protein [Candidatus Methanomethylophilaceae archaeon]